MSRNKIHRFVGNEWVREGESVEALCGTIVQNCVVEFQYDGDLQDTGAMERIGAECKKCLEKPIPEGTYLTGIRQKDEEREKARRG